MRTLCKWSRNALRQKISHLTSFMGFRTILSTSLILSMPGKRSAMSRRVVLWKRCTSQKTRGKAARWRRDSRGLYGSFAHFRLTQYKASGGEADQSGQVQRKELCGQKHFQLRLCLSCFCFVFQLD